MGLFLLRSTPVKQSLLPVAWRGLSPPAHLGLVRIAAAASRMLCRAYIHNEVRDTNGKVPHRICGALRSIPTLCTSL